MTTEPAQKLRAAIKQRLHWDVVLAIAVLPISYVPYEFGVQGINLAPLHLALIVALGFRYRVWTYLGGWLELVGAAAAGWIALRLLVFAPLMDEGIQLPQALSELAPLVAGIFAFRLARVQALRQSIVRGVTFSVVITLAVEAYQYAAGTGRLQGLGYVTPAFNYYTEDAAFRPFSTFYSPTVFAAWLMVAVLAVLFLERGHLRWAVGAAGIIGLAFTFTRASWIGFLVGAAVALVFIPRASWYRAFPFLAIGGMSAVAAVIAVPGSLDEFSTRFQTIGSSEFTSNSDRTYLWQAVFDLYPTNPIVGYGAAPFRDEANRLIGSIAQLGHAHSNYLEQLYLYGIPGMLLFVAILAVMLLTAAHGKGVVRAGGIAIVLAFAVDSFLETSWGAFNVTETMFLLVGVVGPAAPLADREIHRWVAQRARSAWT